MTEEIDSLKLRIDREAGKIQSRYEALFSTYRTQTLLDMRPSCYGAYPDWIVNEDSISPFVEGVAKFYALKKVLATRPHVRNKAESKKLRQTKARQNQGNGKARDR